MDILFPSRSAPFMGAIGWTITKGFGKMYKSTKTYGHDVGLSCCFRQWRAGHSHCRFLHGYAISVRIEFSAYELDERNWVVDFGALDEIKNFLKNTFDHKLLVAGDDPSLDMLMGLDELGLAQIEVLPDGVGCEKFAEHIWKRVTMWLCETKQRNRVFVNSVEVKEHGANSAIYEAVGC